MGFFNLRLIGNRMILFDIPQISCFLAGSISEFCNFLNFLPIANFVVFSGDRLKKIVGLFPQMINYFLDFFPTIHSQILWFFLTIHSWILRFFSSNPLMNLAIFSDDPLTTFTFFYLQLIGEFGVFLLHIGKCCRFSLRLTDKNYGVFPQLVVEFCDFIRQSTDEWPMTDLWISFYRMANFAAFSGGRLTKIRDSPPQAVHQS